MVRSKWELVTTKIVSKVNHVKVKADRSQVGLCQSEKVSGQKFVKSVSTKSSILVED